MTQVAEGSSSAAEMAVAAAAQGVRGRRPLADLVEKNMAEIEKALPPGVMEPERFVRIILTEFRKTPKLLTCTAESFMGALFQTAQLGLEPGGSLGHAYLIPYDNRKLEVTECQLQVGYKGFVELGGRRGILISAKEVTEGDEFEFDLGSNEYLHHTYKLDQEIPRAEQRVIGFYGKVTFPDGRTRFHVMDRSEINRRRDRSSAVQAAKRTDWMRTPWDTDYDAMARKTVIRAMVPTIPLAPDLQIALKADEAVIQRGAKGDLSYLYRDAIDIPAVVGGGEPSPEDEPGEEPPPAPVDLSGVPEITGGILADLEGEVQAQASAYVEAYMDEHPQAVDEQVAHALELWLNSDPGDSPSEAPGSPEGAAGGDTPPEAPAAHSPPGTSDTGDILVETQRQVDTWPIDTVKRVLREWNESAAGAEKSMRLRLSTRLALERQRGNQAAIDLF